MEFRSPASCPADQGLTIPVFLNHPRPVKRWPRTAEAIVGTDPVSRIASALRWHVPFADRGAPLPLPGRGSFLVAEEAIENSLAEFERRVIRKKAALLVHQRLIPCGDREDVKQELALALAFARKRAGPGLGDRQAFTHTVVNNAGSKLVRARFAAKRHPARVSSLDAHPVDEERVIATRRDQPSGEALAALAHDVATILARMPAKLRRVAELLMSGPIAEAARLLGMPRTTVHELIPALRDHFARAGLDGLL